MSNERERNMVEPGRCDCVHLIRSLDRDLASGRLLKIGCGYGRIHYCAPGRARRTALVRRLAHTLAAVLLLAVR